MSYALGQNCAFAAGNIVTLSSSASNARAGARQGCLNLVASLGGGPTSLSCTQSAFDNCAAVAVGQNSARRCNIRGHVRNTLSAARAATLQECRDRLGASADCRVLAAACASGGPDSGTWRPSTPSPSPSPSPTPSPSPGAGTPLRDVNVTIPSSCARQVQVCVRDHECEDGDQIRVSLNGSVIFSGELFNAWNCQNVPVQQGVNRFELFAINGTGFKGNCSHADANTGEIVITGGNTRGTQSWEHRGGAGSSANLNVTIGPPGGTCTPTGSQPGSGTGPGTGTRLYGAVASAFHSQCQGRAVGMSSGHSDEASAESRALQLCQSRRSSSLPGCSVTATFGSAYRGNHQCAAVAYGERTSGNATSCRLRVGTGSTESAAQSDALSQCRSGGFSCSIEPSDRGGLLSDCAQ